MDQYWADLIALSKYPSNEPGFHVPGLATSQRPGLTVDHAGRAATSAENLIADVFAGGTTDLAILNPLFVVQHAHHPRREQALARALNTWIAEEWLARDPRLRASIVVPMNVPESAATEIRHWSGHPGFVQVLVLCQNEMPLGREIYWPIWAAAQEAGLPVAIKLGGNFRQAPTSTGWPTTYLEWYVGQQASFEAQLANIVSEGVFAEFPETKIVVTEGGFVWFPVLAWRLDKLWKSYQAEFPWVKRPPGELLRKHVRFTTAPADGVQAPGRLDVVVDRLGADDMLLYSSGYPYRHASAPHDIRNGTASAELLEKIYRSNAAAVYRIAA
jgi:predicted TIM-barrel fold metal-dependent hydrolase